MDKWDESAADVAVVEASPARSLSELFDLFAHYGARHREIGRKGIYVSIAFAASKCIGWQHASRSAFYAPPRVA